MKVVIVEDEKPAADKLRNALLKCDDNIVASTVLTNVAETVKWLQENEQPELIFMDIELSDGLSFKIFEQVAVSCPVIFTTAYDEYWQEAFEYNSIDYLLKPIRQDKLQAALKKYETLKKYFTVHFSTLKQWELEHPPYKKRFLVKRGADYISIKTENIAYLYATHKLVCLVDNNNQKFIIDQSLSDIEQQLDPSQFYRVSRKYLVNMPAIKLIKTYPKGKLKLEVEPAIHEDIIIAHENVAGFKQWMAK
ncbi:MAG TPA: LytTR family DNA-binding domain-containing protein [Agriterribacter sp.]|nr:LytTR family DNA-binding domain-containing protein [Agriterribacter sp.]